MAASAPSDTTLLRDSPVETRILDATLRCIGRSGVAKLTLDEVAREAGCGRATVYRTFPDGKDGVIAAAAAHEVERFFATVGVELDAADSLEDLLVAGLSGAARFVLSSEPLLYLAAHEPGVVLTHVAFDRVNVVFEVAHRFLAPRLERFLPREDMPAATEWVTRVTLFYLCLPYTPLDLTDPAAARHLARTFLMPGLVPGYGEIVDLTYSPSIPSTPRS